MNVGDGIGKSWDSLKKIRTKVSFSILLSAFKRSDVSSDDRDTVGSGDGFYGDDGRVVLSIVEKREKTFSHIVDFFESGSLINQKSEVESQVIIVETHPTFSCIP